MARATKLKVYRTAIGFHDAYVAAPSQKAALEAWGSDKDLFGRGVAEIVTDPALTEEPLASPGKVVRRLRGTADEQMAALPPDKPRRDVRSKGSDQAVARPTRATAAPPRAAKRKPKPAPSRAKLVAAEEALTIFDAQARERLDELERREAALVKERTTLLSVQETDRARLARRLDHEREGYDGAIARWRAP